MLFKHQLPEAGIRQMRECVASNCPLGIDRFRADIEWALCRSVGEKRCGRLARVRLFKS